MGLLLLKTLAFVIIAAAFTPAQGAPLYIVYGDGAKLDGANIAENEKVHLPLVVDWGHDLRWGRNPEYVDGYKVHLDINGSGMKEIRDVSGSPPPIGTQIKFSDTGIKLYDEVCYSLKAYTTIAISGYSDSLCVTIDPIKFVDFYLDGILVNREELAPWDFKLGQLTPGEHQIKAIINLGIDGDTLTQVAAFTVKQYAPASPRGLEIKVYPLY